MPNRLADSQSPYLLQHAHNPVDWFPWGDEAFNKAKAENKPIFLSVGYSTCHWCHVMERESFEVDATAQILNEHFVSIKVDREERPDVDKLYMNFVMLASGGQGGWPMSVFLTPDLKPFYGGTYFPPVDGYGRPGFPSLLNSIARAWSQDRENIESSAQNALETLRDYVESGAQTGENSVNWRAIYDGCKAQLERSFDAQWGGFGGPPKFPRPVQHDFLHAYFALFGDQNALSMSEMTLQMMNERGLTDQLGGGYHRYSVDEFWIVTHFEKMLYDQAQLVISNLEMFGISENPIFSDAAEKTLRYVWRDLTHIDGGFFAAEDADSFAKSGDDHKKEGAFYVWKKREIDVILGAQSRVFCDFYGISEGGNAPKSGDPHGEFRGQNILFESEAVNVVAKMNGLTVRQALESLENSRNLLFEARQRRPRPHRDDKIISFWNGLMISAFARAATVLNNPKYARQAVGAARFVQSELWDGEILYRHFKDGRAPVEGFAEDYAAMARACLDLYDATFETKWLDWAQKLAGILARKFYDEQNGGFWNGNDPQVLLRFKEDYDGAEPAATSLAVEVGARLFHLLGRDDWREIAEKSVDTFTARLEQIPSSMPLLLRGKMLLDAPPQHIVIAGEGDEARDLIRVARAGFAPFRSVIWLDEKSRAFWSKKQPFLSEMKAREGAATAYVCQNFSCQNPVSSAEELRALLS